MSNEFTVDSWEAFLDKVSELKASHSKDTRAVLFRGHQSSEWRLATTLERFTGSSKEVSEYYRVISYLKPQIESLTGSQWELPTYPEIRKLCQQYDEFSKGNFPGYGYMAHLRHHGFPSPLLDWSRSPYVAAYFAFGKEMRDESASIYMLFESRSHSGSSRYPQIINPGSYVKTHKRHFLQQSEYTLCLQFEDEEWNFVSHEGNFETWDGKDYADNFSVFKINIPASERIKILKALEEFNMNAFSLFGSEESLMETLAVREMQLISESL